MLEEIKSSTHLSCSAERSALVADALRGSDRLFEGVRRTVRLKVYGESMLPALWPGDVVEIASCSLEDLQSGDIVLALRDGRLFLHRLVAAQPNGFVLRGDSVPAPDPLFPPEALLGRLVRRLHERRDVMGPAQSPRTSVEWLGANWSRAAGIFFCYCGLARRVALRLHSRRKALARDLPTLQHNEELATLELNTAEIGSLEAGAC